MEKKKYFIYILTLTDNYKTETNWNKESEEIISQHFNYLKNLTQKKQVVLAGRIDYRISDKNTFGIVVFESASEEQAKELMQNDPAVKNQIMLASLHPFSLALLRN